jgi:hypothetical protein
MIFSGDEIRGGGECRRHPPTMRGEYDMVASFPVVGCDWWCGHFGPQAVATLPRLDSQPKVMAETRPRLLPGPSGSSSVQALAGIAEPRCTSAADRLDASCRKLIQKLRGAPDGRLPHSVLLKRMKMDAKNLRDVAATLEQRGDIHRVPVETAGRTGHVYQLLRN